MKPLRKSQVDVVSGWLWLGGSGACAGICVWLVTNFDPWPAVIPFLAFLVGALLCFAAALGTWEDAQHARAHER